jgi:hypothetical protein
MEGAYQFEMSGTLESPFRFLINFEIQLSHPPMDVWIVVSDLFLVAVENGVACPVKTNRGREEPTAIISVQSSTLLA